MAGNHGRGCRGGTAERNAYQIKILDPVALKYTLPVPVAIMGAALLTIFIRFRKFDPVGVVERRLV